MPNERQAAIANISADPATSNRIERFDSRRLPMAIARHNRLATGMVSVGCGSMLADTYPVGGARKSGLHIHLRTLKLLITEFF